MSWFTMVVHRMRNVTLPRIRRPRHAIHAAAAPRLARVWALPLPLALSLALVASCASHPPPKVTAVDVNVPAPPARVVPTANRALVEDFKKAGVEAREVVDGVVIYLPAIFQFDFDESTLTADTRKQLRAVAKLLLTNSTASRHIIVEGHTDAVGTDVYNHALSARRADAVVRELTAAGVASSRITRRAVGAARPVEPNRKPDGSDNPEGRAKNRRVALLIENPAPRPQPPTQPQTKPHSQPQPR
jgi:outer membrane protein OmpA-like peptidoglycan-associated protein